MTQGKSGEETRGEGRLVSPQGIADTMASGQGGTPVGGRRGLSRKVVAMKSPAPRASGAGSKQPTRRTSVKQKAKRAATAKRAGIGARTPTKDVGMGMGMGMGRKVVKKASGAAAARKAAATRNTAAKRASKTGATRKRVHVRH